jgi:hypothetical protein
VALFAVSDCGRTQSTFLLTFLVEASYMDEFDRWSRMISALLPPVAKAASHHSGEHQEGRSCDKRYNESLIDYRRGSLRTASAFSRTRVGLIE